MTCATCGREMRAALEGGLHPVWLCLPCGSTLQRGATVTRQASRQRTDLLERARDMRESVLVGEIREALEGRGYVVVCVGQRNARGAGNTVGAADLYATRVGRNEWKALEVKAPGGRARPEQARLIAAGCCALVRSVEDALAAVEEERGNDALQAQKAAP